MCMVGEIKWWRLSCWHTDAYPVTGTAAQLMDTLEMTGFGYWDEHGLEDYLHLYLHTAATNGPGRE